MCTSIQTKIFHIIGMTNNQPSGKLQKINSENVEKCLLKINWPKYAMDVLLLKLISIIGVKLLRNTFILFNCSYFYIHNTYDFILFVCFILNFFSYLHNNYLLLVYESIWYRIF